MNRQSIWQAQRHEMSPVAGTLSGMAPAPRVSGPDCEIDTAAQMRWEYVDDDVNKSIDVVRNPA